jgi:ketosteroid isomerase-like protein
MSDLEQVRLVEQLLIEYCYAVDGGDAEAVVRLFTEDCSFDVGHGVEISGQAELLSFFERRLAQYSASSHQLSNIKVSLDSASASASSYVYARIWPLATEVAGELWARYVDTVVSTPAGWRIERRSIRAAGWHSFPSFDDQPELFERIPRRPPA